MPKRKRPSRSKSSRAAKKGWETRRRKQRELEEARELLGAPIVEIEGPHKRRALTKDWDGLKDHDALAKAAREQFPNAKAWQYAFQFEIPAMDGERRWISIPFGKDFRQQLTNAKDQTEASIQGILGHYKGIIPIAVSIIVQE